MSEVATREDKISHIGWEIINGVTLIVMAAASLMDQSLSPLEERLTEKHPTQYIRHGSTTIETVS